MLTIASTPRLARLLCLILTQILSLQSSVTTGAFTPCFLLETFLCLFLFSTPLLFFQLPLPLLLFPLALLLIETMLLRFPLFPRFFLPHTLFLSRSFNPTLLFCLLRQNPQTLVLCLLFSSLSLLLC